jgi:hypothetical protein
MFFLEVALILTVIGLLFQVAALFFRPKQTRPAEIRQSSVSGQNVVNRTEYAPKAGFDSLQNVVELGSTIPVVYTSRETINGITYGGVRVATSLLWSQMLSFGGSQMLRAVFLVAEGGIGEIDPKQFAFGDNLVGGYDLADASAASSRVTFYARLNGGRIVSSDRVSGRAAANDPGNAQNAGGTDVFQIVGLNNAWASDFCYSFKPSTQTQFGCYQLIGNGLAYRVNPQLRPAVVVKTEPSGKTDTRLLCNPDGVAVAQRNKYNTLFSSQSGVTHKNGNPVSGAITLNINDTITYSLNAGSDAATIFVGAQEGQDHTETCRDVAQTVSGRQRGWDDALVIGDLYRFGSALLICESRTPSDEIFASEADQEPIGGGQNVAVTLRCVRSGIAIANAPSAAHTATNTSHLLKCAIATFALPRAAQVVELGFRSSLGIRISGICNFRDSLSHTEIDGRACSFYSGRTYAPSQSLELSTYQSGSYSGSEIRYAFFKVGYRVAGSDEQYTFLSPCFGARSLTQQAVYNFLRIQMPSLQRWEFRIEPVSGWEIRNSTFATGNLEVLDARIGGYRTVTSGSGANQILVTYSGEPVARTTETFAIAATRDKGLGVTLTDSGDYADSWGKLAEDFVFEEMQSSAQQPEHELVYVNLITTNEEPPQYDDMALVGINLRSNTEVSQLNQLTVYINKGNGNGAHTFPDVFRDALTNSTYGVGSIQSPVQIDYEAFETSSDWTRSRRYFYGGGVDTRVNLRQWGSQTASFFLLDFVIRNGKWSLQPAVLFDTPEPITNLFTAGNIIDDSFELSYIESEQRLPKRLSIKWRQERANNDETNRGLFPVVREVTVREASTPSDAPLESIDLSDFVTSEEHAIDVGKFLSRGPRLITHSIKFKTVPTQAALEIGRCFKLGLETVAYLQPNNGAIDKNGVVTSVSELPNGTYDVLLWDGVQPGIQTTTLTITDNRTTQYTSAVFCIRQETPETRTYKAQAISYDEDGNIQVEALYFPLSENGYSSIVDGWDVASNWVIEGRIGASETSGPTTSSFLGVDIVGPSTTTVNVATSFTALISGTSGSYTYSWSGAGVTFGSPSSATTTVTATSSGSKTITCTVTSGAVVRTKSKTLSAVSASTLPVIGTVSLTGDTTTTINTAEDYTLEYTSKPAATTAGSFVVGRSYQIVTSGTTNFTTIGASDSNIGTVFTATGAGTGTGTADELGTAFFAWNWSSTTPDASASVTNSGTPRAKVTFTAAGVYTLTGSISSPTASDGPTKTASIVVTVT